MESLSPQVDKPLTQRNPLEEYFYVLCLISDFESCLLFSRRYGHALKIEYVGSRKDLISALASDTAYDVIVADEASGGWELLEEMRRGTYYERLPFILLVNELNREVIKKARTFRADDVYSLADEEGDLLVRLQYLAKRQYYNAQNASRKIEKLGVETPWWKRAIDVVFTLTALLLLAPVLLVIVILIRLDSKGPIMYKSKRVGSGYRIFNLYKFRTMRTDADQLIAQMASLSMYHKSSQPGIMQSENNLCAACAVWGKCQNLLFSDNREMCEQKHKQHKEQVAAFLKFQNDPRITRIGKFLRNTSLDELPQLLNILRGDMSLVGNRPLPLYEAEKLTTDDKIMRFAGPGGLTGLWQVTKRGKGAEDMSEEERIQLDIDYVKNFSFWLDITIVFKTIPALFQSENV
jgi:lipopolysaccharide/colanic/teichoic acid biosynthesis glycosyltransferase